MGRIGALLGAALAGGGTSESGGHSDGSASGEGSSDHITMLSGTAQNILGLGVFVLASFGMNVLIARSFKGEGADVLGIVTLATQIAFVVGAATRFGMDMAATRLVAIDFGAGDLSRVRSVVRTAALIALAVSTLVGLLIYAASPWLGEVFEAPTAVFWGVALAVPFVALTQVFAAASRGLKIMRHTLYAYWVGQSVSWIVFSLIAWTITKSAAATVFAYAASWILGTAIGWFFWRKESRKFAQALPVAGLTSELVRYGAPRAAAALLSQALFWVDLFVLGLYASHEVLGVYAAAVRVAQTLVLFLTAVSYMFSPFVADLHERGETERLDGLFKSITRWTLALTLPLLSLLLVLPGAALALFGGDFTTGARQLRILLIGQIVNVSVGAAGFILIMVKRTGWDLVVYGSSFLLDVVISFLLIPHLGATGAAIAQTLTITFANAFRIYLVWKFVDIHPYNVHYFKLAIPFAACLAAMTGLAVLTHSSAWPVQLLVVGVFGGITYAVVFLFTAVTPTEKEVLSKLRARSAG